MKKWQQQAQSLRRGEEEEEKNTAYDNASLDDL
jgi:hypothetical protein